MFFLILFGNLFTVQEDQKVIWLTGLPGAGKTTIGILYSTLHFAKQMYHLTLHFDLCIFFLSEWHATSMKNVNLKSQILFVIFLKFKF